MAPDRSRNSSSSANRRTAKDLARRLETLEKRLKRRLHHKHFSDNNKRRRRHHRSVSSSSSSSTENSTSSSSAASSRHSSRSRSPRDSSSSSARSSSLLGGTQGVREEVPVTKTKDKKLMARPQPVLAGLLASTFHQDISERWEAILKNGLRSKVELRQEYPPPANCKSSILLKMLLDSKALNCQSCKKLMLQLPVFLVDGVGTVCKTCTTANGWNGNPIEIFNVLLKQLTVPCTNAIAGCEKPIPYEQFEEHILKDCKYRPVECPHQKCASMISQDNFSSHFLENHKENVIKSDSFNFQFNIEEPTIYYVKLLVKRHLKFFLVLQQNKEADELACSLFKFHEEAPSSTTITFSNSGNEEYSFTIVINSINLLCRESDIAVKKISLSILRSMFHEDILTLNVVIPPNDPLLQILECPICIQTMRPPIYLCEKGHTICNNCCKNIQKCPTCTGAISKSVRNYYLENATSNVFYSCDNKKSGCATVLSGDMIMDHESKCLYRTYKCPHCKFHYNHKNVSNHLQYKHKDITKHFEFDIKGHGHYYFKKAFIKSMYINGFFFRVNYLCDAGLLSKRFVRHHTMRYVYLQFKLLNSDKQVQHLLKKLHCKISIKNPTTEAEATQIQLLTSAEKNKDDNDLFWIFVPIEAMNDSVDVHRKAGRLIFRCELLMKVEPNEDVLLKK